MGQPRINCLATDARIKCLPRMKRVATDARIFFFSVWDLESRTLKEFVQDSNLEPKNP